VVLGIVCFSSRIIATVLLWECCCIIVIGLITGCYNVKYEYILKTTDPLSVE
jgi:hypothetical protein